MTKKIDQATIKAVMGHLGSIVTPKKLAHLQRCNEARKTHEHDFSEGNKCKVCKKYKSQFGKKYL